MGVDVAGLRGVSVDLAGLRGAGVDLALARPDADLPGKSGLAVDLSRKLRTHVDRCLLAPQASNDLRCAAAPLRRWASGGAGRAGRPRSKPR
ncbi:hypothetical protein Afe04nite_19700 [Asanoa ferruginea]|nr:hypothetical protein Afe04nite_19700 [Asanoa ferruginea]